MVLAFTPPGIIDVNWTNNKCESKNPKDLVDDFGGSASDLIYLCAKVFTYSDLRKTVENSATGTDVWNKNNLPALARYAQDLPRQALLVTFQGSRYREKQVFYNIYLRRNSDLQTDSDYVSQIRAWTHSTGLMLRDVLEGKAARFTQPPLGQGATAAPSQTVSPAVVESARARADEAAIQVALQLQRDRDRFETERQVLEREKIAFERQKMAAQKEHDQKVERERAELLARAKALCLRAFNSANSETALRQFIDDFSGDECGQQAAARQKLAELDDKRQRALKDSKDSKERERQTKLAQAQALLGSTVQFQESFKHCLPAPGSSACQPEAYKFRVKGKIFDLDLRRGDGVLVEVTEVVLIDGASEQADAAFRQKMLGTKVWRSKADLGLVY